MGAWIEIRICKIIVHNAAKSHPSWVRGLKFAFGLAPVYRPVVAPFMGAWIEIWHQLLDGGGQSRRTLHGCVD